MLPVSYPLYFSLVLIGAWKEKLFGALRFSNRVNCLLDQVGYKEDTEVDETQQISVCL